MDVLRATNRLCNGNEEVICLSVDWRECLQKHMTIRRLMDIMRKEPRVRPTTKIGRAAWSFFNVSSARMSTAPCLSRTMPSACSSQRTRTTACPVPMAPIPISSRAVSSRFARLALFRFREVDPAFELLCQTSSPSSTTKSSSSSSSVGWYSLSHAFRRLDMAIMARRDDARIKTNH